MTHFEAKAIAHFIAPMVPPRRHPRGAPAGGGPNWVDKQLDRQHQTLNSMFAQNHYENLVPRQIVGRMGSGMWYIHVQHVEC
jgi:hypothetical protein